MKANLLTLRKELAAIANRPCSFSMNAAGHKAMHLVGRLAKNEQVSDDELLDALVSQSNQSVSIDLEAQAAEASKVQLIAGKSGQKDIAFVSVRGVATFDFEFQPFVFSTRLLEVTVNELAADENIGKIVLHMDSPGGAVTGVQEAGDAVFEARAVKEVVALVDPLSASAAYWIASQATEIVAVPSADVGSIGVFMMHVDISGMLESDGIKPTFIFAGENKVEGNMFEPLSDEARAHFQSEVDTIYDQFIAAVARGRGTSTKKVLSDFGQGRVFGSERAKSVGMIDSVEPIGSALMRMNIISSGRKGAKSEAEDKQLVEILADEVEVEENIKAINAELAAQAKRRLDILRA